MLSRKCKNLFWKHKIISRVQNWFGFVFIIWEVPILNTHIQTNRWSLRSVTVQRYSHVWRCCCWTANTHTKCYTCDSKSKFLLKYWGRNSIKKNRNISCPHKRFGLSEKYFSNKLFNSFQTILTFIVLTQLMGVREYWTYRKIRWSH